MYYNPFQISTFYCQIAKTRSVHFNHFILFFLFVSAHGEVIASGNVSIQVNLEEQDNGS